MTTLSIELQDELARRLESEAQRLNVSPTQLATLGVVELLERSDAEFEQIARRVINDNKELLRRLAK